MTERDDMDLEDLFAVARDLHPRPSGDLMACLLADASAVLEARTASQDRPAVLPARRAPRPARSWLRALAGALGGWPTVGGLVASSVLGVSMGVAQPAGVSALTTSLWGEPVSITLGIDEDPLSLLEE